MIKKQPGEIFEYENFRYSIGDWMRCSEESDYAGLSGIILEIRDGEDRETDNPTPDIYCRLQIPRNTSPCTADANFQSCTESQLKSQISR